MPTFETYNQNGLREDLLDIIVNISPTETPMLSGFGKGKASGTLHEWLTDSLTAGSNGRVAEGAAFTAGTLTARSRLGNYTQINRKSFEVTDTLDAVDKAGVKGGEYEYQLAKSLKIMATDMEVDIVSGVSAAGASAGTGRAARGVLSFITTNVETGSAAGTQALTELLYNTNLQTIFNSGGNPDTTYANGFQKRQISAFTASQTRNIEASSKKLIASLDVYESDFGMQRIILDRHMDADKVCQLQKEMWKVAMLRPVKHTPIAKVGSSRRGMVEAEWTLESLNEAASGKITLLTVA
jgi:hypothetical protein|tara:strand:- start:7144 stop:8034 length:891 start_codon:yes stop_codon:yes gene_type:complete